MITVLGLKKAHFLLKVSWKFSSTRTPEIFQPGTSTEDIIKYIKYIIENVKS